MSEIAFRPRPAQGKILAYAGGRMGVSAVPGSGKTYTLSALAARLVATTIADDQEVLIVTLVNSAVENFKARVATFIQQRGLLANVGYRVRTLHGLAHDIVRERPGLVGLADDFQIVDEREAEQIRESVVEMWLKGHPNAADPFLKDDLSDNQREWIAHQQWPEAVFQLSGAFIRRAKDLQLGPVELAQRIEPYQGEPAFSLARMGADIYADYQKALYYRGGVDFDDLIRLALVALEQDGELLDRLRHRWPFILEDEAQDSSLLQERILDKLARPGRSADSRLPASGGNWVRVGDPNQAINATFTTASPEFLRRFLQKPGVLSLPLDNSGRSQQHIINLANYLVEWTMQEHLQPLVRDALAAPPFIQPAPPGDPQPNPPADRTAIHLFDRRLTPEEEIKVVVDSLSRWLPKHGQDRTVAVLTPRNQRGFEVTDALRRAGLPYIELLRSTTSTRRTADALGHVLKCLSTPSSAPLLARTLEAWRREDQAEEEAARRIKRLSGLIRRCSRVEEYLWPRLGNDWLDGLDWSEEPQAEDRTDGQSDRDMLEAFRTLICRWQEATVLPIDQLVLTIAQDLFIKASELALSYKLAMMLRAASDNNPHWRLAELTDELFVIARNQRRFLGFDAEDTGFEPQPGVITVSTLHKAKGLEWDRVYLLSVNNYDFPSAQPYDEYIGEPWYVRDHLNLEAEALAQLEAVAEGKAYVEREPTRQARLDYARERLRLLYMGITRARRELIVTWNTGRSRQAKQMAVPFIELCEWWKQQGSDLRLLQSVL